MSDLQINTRVRRLFQYLEDFERGVIRIPAFQRDFEWGTEQKVKLFDSIKNGYPIGSILFWRPFEDKIAGNSDWVTNQIGTYFLPKRTTDYFYILDGYQRLSTLFGCLVNPMNTQLERDYKLWEKEFNLIYDLEQDRIIKKNGLNYKVHEIPLYELADSGGFLEFQAKLFVENLEDQTVELYKNRYKAFSRKLSSYDLASIDLIGGDVEEAIDIFTRLNSSGAKITDDWILSALSFSLFESFRLGTEVDELLSNLKQYNFHKLKRKVVYQCIINAFGNVFFDQTTKNDIKNLKRLSKLPNFVAKTRNTIKNIKRAVHFLYTEVHVLNSKLLPYNSQLIFITDFFNKVETPTPQQLEKLKHWFWFTTYSNYFTNYNLGEQRKAYQEFQQFIIDESYNPIYISKKLESISVLEFPAKINFGSVRAKALTLFLLKYQLPNKYLIKDAPLVFYKKKLFENIDEIDSGITENTICLGVLPSEFSKFKKNDFFEKYLASNNKRLFITNKMKKKYPVTKGEILQDRKNKIQEAEKEFVENYIGIEYTI